MDSKYTIIINSKYTIIINSYVANAKSDIFSNEVIVYLTSALVRVE